VFAARGYAAATTVEIARRAKVTQPLVHHYFRSKERLWRAVLDELFGRLSTELFAERARAEGEPAVQRLRRMLVAFVRFSGLNPELSRLTRAESVAGGAPFDILFRHLVPLVKMFEAVMNEGIREGVFSKTETSLAYFFVVGACTQPFAHPETAKRAFGLDVRDPKVVERYAEFVVELMKRALRVGEATRVASPAPRSPTGRRAGPSRPRAAAQRRR